MERLVQERSWIGYAAAFAGVGGVTLVVAAVEQVETISNISMLYLLPVLAAAVAFGRGPAIAAALTGFVTFDLFFIHPRYTPTVSDPSEWVALFLLLVTGLVTAAVADLMRRRAEEASAREREAVILFDVVRRLGRVELAQSLRDVAELLRRELDVSAVVIDLEREGPVRASAEAGDSEAIELARSERTTPESVLAAGGHLRPGSAGRWVRIVPGNRQLLAAADAVRRVPIEQGGQRLGAITLVAGRGSTVSSANDRLLSAVAAQIAQTVERESFRRAATEAEILLRTDELKTALLNAVSHDLRTPLASIIASAGSLRQDDVSWSAEDRRNFAEAIEDEARRLNRIVGNLLDLSRIEAGTLRPEKSWYDFGALVDDVLGRLKPLAADHKLKSDVPPDLPPVLLDYVQIDEVLTNLAENAIKHTPAGSEVVIRAGFADGQLWVEMEDDGPGIPSESLHRLFDRFYRVGAGDRSQGTGLGLSVARGFVEAHGGAIRAENMPQGGARFIFTLPLPAAEPALAAGSPG